MRGSAERKEMVGRERERKREVVDRKQLDFGVACHAGNTSRFCKPRGKERETDGGRKRVSLLAARRLRRCFADHRMRRGRIEWLERKEREREIDRDSSLRGLLLPGGHPDTCSGHIVVKRLPTGPLMARDDILQVGPSPSRGCATYVRRMCAQTCAWTQQLHATDKSRKFDLCHNMHCTFWYVLLIFVYSLDRI